MTVEQNEHLDRVRGQFILRLDEKYTKGQAEHGGNLWDNSPLWMADQILDEATDQFTYGQTNRDQWIVFLNFVVKDPHKGALLAQDWLKELK